MAGFGEDWFRMFDTVFQGSWPPKQFALKNYRHVAIIGDVPFTWIQQKTIKDAIVATVNARKSNIPPEFSGIWWEDGMLIANAADDESEKWLIDYQGTFAALSGCKLQVRRRDEIPDLFCFDAVFHCSEQYTDDEILYALESQARQFALSTKEWIVLDRYERGRTVTLTILIDSDSSVYIQEKNFFLPYRLGHAKFYYDDDDDLPTTRSPPTIPATIPVAMNVEKTPPVTINPIPATQLNPEANMMPKIVISCPNIKRQHENESLPGSPGSDIAAKKLKMEAGPN